MNYWYASRIPFCHVSTNVHLLCYLHTEDQSTTFLSDPMFGMLAQIGLCQLPSAKHSISQIIWYIITRSVNDAERLSNTPLDLRTKFTKLILDYNTVESKKQLQTNAERQSSAVNEVEHSLSKTVNLVNKNTTSVLIQQRNMYTANTTMALAALCIYSVTIWFRYIGSRLRLNLKFLTVNSQWQQLNIYN